MPLVFLPKNVAYHLEHVQTVLPDHLHNFKLNFSNSSSPYSYIKNGLVYEDLEYDWSYIKLAVEMYLTKAKDMNARVQLALEECSKIIPDGVD